jgi:hypothetical protein
MPLTSTASVVKLLPQAWIGTGGVSECGYKAFICRGVRGVVGNAFISLEQFDVSEERNR